MDGWNEKLDEMRDRAEYAERRVKMYEDHHDWHHEAHAILTKALQWVIEHDETTAYVQNKCHEALERTKPSGTGSKGI